jgi:hypothetical protein
MDRRLPGPLGNVSGIPWRGPANPWPALPAGFTYDWARYWWFPDHVVADASSFPGGNPFDGSYSNSVEAIQSALGYTTTYNPITGTGGVGRPSDPSFLSPTTFSPVTT